MNENTASELQKPKIWWKLSRACFLLSNTDDNEDYGTLEITDLSTRHLSITPEL